MKWILSTSNLTMHFGGLKAVQDLELVINEGEIRSLIGPNGSGKTTVINMITGVYSPTHGTILWGGETNPVDITKMSPHKITSLGLARTFQTIRLFPRLSTLSNVMIARYCRTHANLFHILMRSSYMKEEEEEIRSFAKNCLQFVGLEHSMTVNAKNLAHGERRMLEIARALATEPKLLILDEPAAGMNPTEAVEMVKLLRKIRSQGITILLIEHNMRVAMSVSDNVTVINFGQKIAEGCPTEVQNNSQVIQAYLGKEALGVKR